MGELITRLKQRLEENPDDGDGWYLLSRSYMAESRYAEALEALNKTHAIYGDHAAILVGMADAAAMTRGGDLTGKPTEHLEKALELEPENSTALWLGGMSAQQNGKFQLAVDRWSKLIPQLHSDQQSLQEVNSLIQQAVAEAKASGIEVVVSEPEMAPPAPALIPCVLPKPIPEPIPMESPMPIPMPIPAPIPASARRGANRDKSICRYSFRLLLVGSRL